MIHTLNQWSQVWIGYFGLAIIQNTIFLGLVFLALLLLRNASARLKYLVALVGLFKLLLPPFWNASFLLARNPFAGLAGSPTAELSLGEIVPLALSSGQDLTLSGWLFCIWLAITLVFILIPFITTMRYQRKLVSGTTPLPAATAPEVTRGSVQIYQTEKTCLPLSLGLFSHRIYLPVLWQTWSADCRNAVLAHEIAHLKRRDGVMQIFQLLVQRLYFFHPLVWLLNAKIHEYREMACDDVAVNNSNLSPMEYSRFLTQVARQVVYSGLGYTSISALIKKKNKLLNRVKYQITEVAMKRKISRIRISVIFFGLLLLLVPFSWYCGKNQSTEQAARNTGARIAADPSDDKVQPYDDPPEPMGGFNVIQDKVGYPESAKNAGIQGKAIVQILIDEQGAIEKAKIQQSTGNTELDQAALRGVQAVQWHPARLQGQAVKVWISVPIAFKLDGDKKTMAIDTPPPPKTPEAPEPIGEFVPYDEPPTPIGGFEAIVKNLRYPELARKAGVQGKVVVFTQIDATGKVSDTKIKQSLGENNGCDEAAIAAIKATQWQPAKREGKPVTVWISIPVVFSLK